MNEGSQGYRLLFYPLHHLQPWGKALPTLCLTSSSLCQGLSP